MPLAPLREAADSLAKASTPEPFSTSKTSNWVARRGGLPAYVQHIAHDLMEKRKLTESRAIQLAIGIVKHPPKNWGAEARAAAAKAAAEWERMKGSQALQHSAASIEDLRAVRDGALGRLALLESRIGLAGIEVLLAGPLQEAAMSSWTPELKRTASSSSEFERHEVHDSGQHVGTVARRAAYGKGEPDRWSAHAVNGDRITDYSGTSRDKALEAVRKHLEEAPARVGKHANGKWLVMRPSSYSGPDTFTAYPSQTAARFGAGLPEKATGPEKASQVQALGEQLHMDLVTVSGLDIPALRRVQEARRTGPFRGS